MRTTLIIFTFLSLISCNSKDEKKIVTAETKQKYEVIGSYFLTFGQNNSIRTIKNNDDSTYSFKIEADNYPEITEFITVKINSEGDTISTSPSTPFDLPINYIRFGNYYYELNTDRRTMGGFTKDYLNKYDKNWNIIWSRNINKPKMPSSGSVFSITDDNEILYISNEYQPNTTKKNLATRRFSLNGKLISEKSITSELESDPVSMMKTDKHHYFLISSESENGRNPINISIKKINSKGDVIWVKKQTYFNIKQSAITRNGDILLYGSEFSDSEKEKCYTFLKVMLLDKNANLKWQKELKKNYSAYAGNFLETKNNNFLFSSSVMPKKDRYEYPYLFELNNNGKFTFEQKFDFHLGMNAVPFILHSKDQITMIVEKNVGNFEDVIQVEKLSK